MLCCVKKSAFHKLKKPSFAGGTITIVSVQGDGHYLEEAAARFEEGTVNYLEIPAINSGLAYIENIGMDHIKNRVACLTKYLNSQAESLETSKRTTIDSALRSGNMAKTGVVPWP